MNIEVKELPINGKNVLMALVCVAGEKTHLIHMTNPFTFDVFPEHEGVYYVEYTDEMEDKYTGFSDFRDGIWHKVCPSIKEALETDSINDNHYLLTWYGLVVNPEHIWPYDLKIDAGNTTVTEVVPQATTEVQQTLPLDTAEDDEL